MSKAFLNSTDISETTKNKILRCAVELGYSLGGAGIKGKIALVVEELGHTDTNSFEYQMIFGFKLAASAKGFDVDVITKPQGEWSYIANVVDKGYAGGFIFRGTYSAGLLRELRQTKLPTVIFDQNVDNPFVASIGCDNEAGIGYAVDHLVELGHTKIAYYGGNPMLPVSMLRRTAFINKIRSCAVPLYPELIFESDFARDYSESIIPKIVDFGATAIVCASDILARFALNRLQAMSVKVPEAISIVGFDNVPLCEETTPKLTSISQGNIEIGRSAFYVLNRIIKHISISKMLFRPTLVVRGSTCQAK